MTTLLHECLPALLNSAYRSSYPPGRNTWVVLDKAWAARLSVPRDRGVYRIRRHELVRRLLGMSRQLDGLSELRIDPAHTSVGFVARHMMIAKVRGRFREVTGRINVGTVPEKSDVEIIVDAASIDTGMAVRDEHLRSPDFLDVANHPHLHFRSTNLEPSEGNTFKLTGELTIRGVTRTVTLDLEFLGAARDAAGKCRVAFEARAEINREDFGLTWNQPLETGGVLIGKQVGLEIEAQAVLDMPTAA